MTPEQMTEQELNDLEERQRGRKRKTDGNYASKYYDPDKAHEYYEKHKKLQALMHPSKDKKKKKSSKKKGSTKKKTSGKKSSSSKKNSYSAQEKQILQQAKQNTDDNIANLKDIVADWEDKQQELIDNAKTPEEKKAIRNRIRAVKREMNKQIREARKIYRDYKSAYNNHNIQKFAAQRAEIDKKTAEQQKGTS